MAAAAALAAFAIFSSEAPLLAIYFCLGLARRVRRVPRARHGRSPGSPPACRGRSRPELALAIGNLGAPGGLTRSVILSLGAGLSLLVTVALIDRSIVAELTGRVPAESPNYFVLDIKRVGDRCVPGADRARGARRAKVAAAPMLRGRLVKLGDRPVEELKAPPEAQWVLNGDRGLTYAARCPDGSTVVAGQWWPADYAGEPLVSFEADIAKGLRLKIGDHVTVNVLGRNVTARIANLREVKWESLSLNFVLVFSPNTLAGAPHNLLATMTLPKDVPLAGEAKLARRSAGPSGLHRHPREGRHRRLQRHLRPRHDRRAGRGQRHPAGRSPGARRRACHRAATAHSAGGDPEDLGRHQLADPALAPGRIPGPGLVNVVHSAPDRQPCRLSRPHLAMEIDFTFSAVAAAQALLLAIVLVALFGGFGTWRVLKAPPVPYLRSE